jgi:hypothetical protein
MMIRVVSFPERYLIIIGRSKLIACIGFTYFYPAHASSDRILVGAEILLHFDESEGVLNACREIIFRTAGGGSKGFPGSR